MRDALDVLIAKGRLPKEEDVNVVVLGGDGSTYDRVLSSTSGAITRNWISTTVATTTSPCAVQYPAGTTQEKKDIFEIWRAHKPPYMATVSPRYPLDLEEKFARAEKYPGPKIFLAFAACPTGWLFDPAYTPAVE